MSAYGSWIGEALAAEISTATIKAMLVDSTYVFDPDQTTVDDSAEISGTGYTAGGVDVTSLVAIAYDSGNDWVAMTLSDVVDFGDVTATEIAGIVFYIDGGKPLVVDMFDPMEGDGSDFAYTSGADGLLVIPVGA